MMNLIKNNVLIISFPYITGKYFWLLLLMGFSVSTFAQIHISGNTVFTVSENTIIYVTGENSDENVQHETPSKKTKTIAKQQKRLKTTSQPPIIKKDTGFENRIGVLAFTSRQKNPSNLFYSVRAKLAAVVNNISVRGKSFTTKKEHYHNIHSLVQNDECEQINIASDEIWLSSKKQPEGDITRPPPFQISELS